VANPPTSRLTILAAAICSALVPIIKDKMAAPRHGDIPIPKPIVVPGAGEGITVMIDNYDSFTFNLVQYLQECGANVRVFRNDKVTIEELKALKPVRLVISPGPGTPGEAGVSNEALREFAGKIPIMGVCLGCQCMYEHFGGTVSFAGEIMHGKQSPIVHDGRGLFSNVPQNMRAIRYHSLAGTLATFPKDELIITSRTDRGIIQGVRHRKYVIEGVQFHPESVATEAGHRLVANFLQMKGGEWVDSSNPGGSPCYPESEGKAAASSSQGSGASLHLDIDSLKGMAARSGLEQGPEAARKLAEAHMKEGSEEATSSSAAMDGGE